MKLLTADDIAALIKQSPRHVKERVIFRDDFPDCFDIGSGHRLWDEQEVIKWVRSHRKRPKPQSRRRAMSSADSA